jgi:hypothetical protein
MFLEKGSNIINDLWSPLVCSQSGMCGLERWFCYEKRMIRGIVVALQECEDRFKPASMRSDHGTFANP